MAVAATVLSSDTPSDAPVCCVVFTIALATPASLGSTPMSAVLLSGTNAVPIPKLTITSAGSRWAR